MDQLPYVRIRRYHYSPPGRLPRRWRWTVTISKTITRTTSARVLEGSTLTWLGALWAGKRAAVRALRSLR